MRADKGKNEKREQRFSLTILLGAVVFVVLVVALTLAGALLYILVRTGIFDALSSDGEINLVELLLIMCATSLIIGFAITVLLGKFPLKPINKLVNGMNSLASGNFDTRLEFKGALATNGTFSEIAESFNKMAEDLQNTELLRGDFINNFSHEFKTPIVSISGFAEMLESAELSDAEREQYIHAIKEESRRLASMATNVLELTKVENQSILTDLSRFNVSEQIRSCFLLLEGKWSLKNIDFNMEFDEHFINGNEEMLKQTWINLLDNAIKFVNEGGEIGVRIIPEGRSLRFDIMNSGETIPEEKQKYIFNKFYQADESHSAKGNGIGLAIVKRIVELHKGSIEMKSENSLTVFTVRLPYSG